MFSIIDDQPVTLHLQVSFYNPLLTTYSYVVFIPGFLSAGFLLKFRIVEVLS